MEMILLQCVGPSFLLKLTDSSVSEGYALSTMLAAKRRLRETRHLSLHLCTSILNSDSRDSTNNTQWDKVCTICRILGESLLIHTLASLTVQLTSRTRKSDKQSMHL